MKPRIMRAAARPTAKAEPANFVGTVLSDPVFAVTGFLMWWLKRRNRRAGERAKAVIQAAAAARAAD